jgi:hypothetical protein
VCRSEDEWIETVSQGYQLIRLPKSAVGAESSRDRSLYDMLGMCPHVKAVAQVGEFEARSDLPPHLEKGSRRQPFADRW